MSEFDADARVRLAFSDFRYGGMRHIRPAGIAAAQARVRRRRQVRIATLSIVAALIIAVPVAAYAVQQNQGAGPGPAATPTEMGSPSVSPEPSGSPSPAASSAPPDAPQVTKDEIYNGTFSVPAWPADTGFGDHCRSGNLKFTDGWATSKDADYKVSIAGDVAYSDVDHDGGKEAIVEVQCFTQGGVSQVLVLDRIPAGGIRTVGRVVATTGPIKVVWQATGTDDGHVRVDVGDLSPCCGGEEYPQHQWRTYALVDGRFRQTDGPTSFPPNPKVSDISVTASDLALGPVSDGMRSGQITVRVANGGPGKADNVYFLLELPLNVERVGPGWAECEPNDTGKPDVQLVRCQIGAVAPGQSKTRTLALSAPANTRPRHDLQIRALDDERWDPGENNYAQYRITVAN